MAPGRSQSRALSASALMVQRARWAARPPSAPSSSPWVRRASSPLEGRPSSTRSPRPPAPTSWSCAPTCSRIPGPRPSPPRSSGCAPPGVPSSCRSAPLPRGDVRSTRPAAGLGADLTKIAALAGDAEELRRLLAVTLAARDHHVVTLAMGPMGPLSRLVLPAAGSLLTYGHVGRPTAPGQLGVAELAAELRRLYPS